MPLNQTTSQLLKRNFDMMRKHLSDFSDADLMVRPVPGANHAAWQLLHLLNVSTVAANAVAPELELTFPAAYVDAAKKDGAKHDQPELFLSKDELLRHLETLHSRLGKHAAALTDERLNVPSPEKFRGFAPTLGDLLLMIPLHTAMHIGQIQVIRRKLNKPVLF